MFDAWTWADTKELLTMIGLISPFLIVFAKMVTVLTRFADSVRELAEEQKRMRLEINERSDTLNRRITSAKEDIEEQRRQLGEHETRITVLEERGKD